MLKVAHDMAGMSYAEADGFRRAMTHDRTNDEMEKIDKEDVQDGSKDNDKWK